MNYLVDIFIVVAIRYSISYFLKIVKYKKKPVFLLNDNTGTFYFFLAGLFVFIAKLLDILHLQGFLMQIGELIFLSLILGIYKEFKCLLKAAIY